MIDVQRVPIAGRARCRVATFTFESKTLGRRAQARSFRSMLCEAKRRASRKLHAGASDVDAAP